MAGAPGAKAAASVRSIGLKASARPRPAGPGRRAAAVAAAAAGSAREWAGGGRRRCLCRGDGPVCTISAGAHPGLLRPLCGRAVATKPEYYFRLNHLSFAELLALFSRLTSEGMCSPLCTELLQSRGREREVGAGGEEKGGKHLGAG